MKTLLVGVIGHVDHGKTALVRALTGVETDRLKEERERGVSIVPGFALLRTTHRDAPAEIDLVDLPGHERFVRAMISGATGMGAVLLAIDAREGIKPQTVEHLEIARLIGVRRGVVALTKCDLLPPGAVAARVAEIAGAIARSGLDAPVIATAIPPDQDPAGRGIEALRGALTDLLEEAPAPVDDGFPYLPVDRIFTRAGFGTIVTGTLRRGTLRVGDTVEIVPGGLTASVRSLQIHGRSVTRAEPGRRTAVALRGLGAGALERGQALCAPGLLGTNGWLDVALTAVASAGVPLPGGLACRLLFGTTEAPARLRLLDRDALEPGDTALAQIRTETEIAVPAREPFLLRLDSPAITVAGGRILDPASRRRRRHDGAVIARLAAMAAGGPTEILTARLAESGAAGETLIDLARRLGCAPERVRPRLAEIGAREIGERFVGAPALMELGERILAHLARHHRDHPMEHGLAPERLVRSLGLGEAVLAAALRDLVANRTVVQAGALYRRADFDPARNETEIVRALEMLFRRAELSPPDESEAVGRDPRRREALAYLIGAGTVIRAVDRVQKRAILFHRDAIAGARVRLAAAFPRATAPEAGFLAREAGGALNISRKFSIPLLEHLDAVGFTRRVGDRRIIAGAPADGSGTDPAP